MNSISPLAPEIIVPDPDPDPDPDPMSGHCCQVKTRTKSIDYLGVRVGVCSRRPGVHLWKMEGDAAP